MIKKDIIQPINYLIEKQAKELKDKIAYADEIENISYKNLNIETKNLSFYLNEKNLNPDDAASIILPNSVNWIVSCFAVLLFQTSWEIGIIVGVSMLLNIVASAIAGVTIPFLLKKIGIDPALASGVMMTTLTDVLGFVTFLGLATLLLL